jgi:hypothetical protein
MNKRHIALAAVAAVTMATSIALLTAAPAYSGKPVGAAPSTPAPGSVHFAGCVKPGVEGGCLMLDSGGHTYDVTSGSALLQVGQFYSGSGVPSTGMTTCQQGERLLSIVLDNPQPKHTSCQVSPSGTKTPGSAN